MASERVRKLAARLGVDAELILATLKELGVTRYQSLDDMLPDKLIHQVEAAMLARRRTKAGASRSLTPAPRLPPAQHNRFDTHPASELHRKDPPLEPLPREFPDEPLLNTALRDYLSSRPVDTLRSKLPGVPETPRKASMPATPPPIEVQLRNSLAAEVHIRRQLAESLEQTRQEFSRVQRVLEHERDDLRRKLELRHAAATQTESDLSSELSQQKHLCGSLESERDQLRSDFERLQKQQHEQQISRQIAEARVRQLEHRLEELETRIRDSHNTPPQETAKEDAGYSMSLLDEFFEERGLLNPDEVRRAMRILLDERHYYDMLEILGTTSANAMRQLLRRRLFLVCYDCFSESMEGPILVADPLRCEHCHGLLLSRELKELGALLRAIRSIHVLIIASLEVPAKAIEDSHDMPRNLTLLRIESTETQVNHTLGEHESLVVFWNVNERSPAFFALTHHPRVINTMSAEMQGPASIIRLIREKLTVGSGSI